MAKQEYKIPAHNLEPLKAQIEKINRRAEKLGATPITLTVGERVEEVAPGANGIERALRLVKGMRIFWMVTLNGEAPRLNGWSFIATIQHAGEAGNIVATVPGIEREATAQYRNGEPVCDHCNLNRKRIDTYIVRHEDGKTRQVGRNCLCDFLGGLDPHNAALIASLMAKAGVTLSQYEDWDLLDGSRGYKESYEITGFLAVTAAVIRKYGWLSRTKAREEGRNDSTADRVYEAMTDPSSTLTVDESDKEEAKLALDWVRDVVAARTEKSDYEHNLTVVCSYDAVDRRGLGLAASVIRARQREEERKVWEAEQATRNAANAGSSYFGTPKKRDTFTLKLERTTNITRAFDGGLTILYRFRDAQGNVAVWFSTGGGLVLDKDGCSQPPVEGKTYEVKGTVKAHEDYRGTKQTILNRCIFQKEVA